MHESNFQKQRSSVENPLDPSLDWLSDSTDTVDTFHGSIKATILPQKLDFNFNGSYSYALGRVEQYSPTVTGNLIYSNLQRNGTQRVRTPIFLGVDQMNYWAQIVGVTLKYKFE